MYVPANAGTYDYMISHCRSPSAWIDKSRFFGTVKQTLKASFLDVESVANAIATNGLSQQVYELLTSKEYYSYLNQCFGNDSNMKNMYTASLIVQDLIARGVGLTLAGGVLYYGGVLLKTVSSLYPAVNIALRAAGIILVGRTAVMLLREYIIPSSPEQKRELENFISENKSNMQSINNRTRVAVKSELKNIEIILSESIYNMNQETSKLILKRQKMILALILLGSEYKSNP